MAWKDLSLSTKFGISFSVLYIFTFIISKTLSFPFFIFSYPAVFFINIILGIELGCPVPLTTDFSPICYEQYLEWFLIILVSGVFYYLFGALIGWIYGKFKQRV